MAIYHCNCKIISRGQGRSAVGAAAYRSGSKLTNEYDGLTHDYRNKGGVVYSEIMLCENAPERYQDRATLWNEVEQIEKGSKAQLAREYEVALPRELDREEQIQLVRDFVQEQFVKKGMCADFSIHDKEDGNPHAHIMVTVRPIDENGKWEAKTEQLYLCKNKQGEERAFTKNELANMENPGEWSKQHHYSKGGNPKGKKVYLTAYEAENNPKYKGYERIMNDRQPKTEKYGRPNPKVEEWNSKEFLQQNREAWAAAINREFEKKNIPERVDNRTLKAQGIDRVPTIHEGVTQREMKGKIAAGKKKPIEWQYDKAGMNQEIRKDNAQAAAIEKEITVTEREIGCIREDMVWVNIHERAADLRTFIEKEPGSEAVQREAMERLAGLEDLSAGAIAAQRQTGLHAGAFYQLEGGSFAYLDYHGGKAADEAAALRQQISQNLEFIKSVPNYGEYRLGETNVQGISEDYRAFITDEGWKTVVQRNELERSILREVKESDRQLGGLYDTAQLHRLIDEQKEARRAGKPAQSQEEVLVRQIQDSFASLQFLEDKSLRNYDQVKRYEDWAEARYYACLDVKEQIENTIRQNEAALAHPERLEPGEAAELRDSIEDLRDKLEDIKPEISEAAGELHSCKQCLATLDRIEGKAQVKEQQKVQEQNVPEQKIQEQKQPEKKEVPFDVAKTAHQLAEYRVAFVKAKEQAADIQAYRENPIYRQQAAQIAELSEAYKDQTAKLQSRLAEREKLGLFQGKQKKLLDNHIASYNSSLRDIEARLKELGVKDPSRADEAVKEKTALAEQEKAKAQAARENAGASTRAAQAKAAFQELARTVPERMKAEVLAEMEKQLPVNRDHGTMAAYRAEMAAKAELDGGLKQKKPMLERGQNHQHRDRSGGPER